MARNQAPSDDGHARRENSYPRRGGYRGRGRARGRYAKGSDYNTRQRPFRNNHEHLDNKRGRSTEHQERNHYHEEDGAEGEGHENHFADPIGEGTIDDLYDDRPVHEEGGRMDPRPLEQRIPVTQERIMEQYGDNVAPLEPLDGQNMADEIPHNIGQRTEIPPNGLSPESRRSGELSSREESRDVGASSKDREELRQKVLESLEQKKKKAAVFMSKELDGSASKEALNDSQDPGRKSSIGNGDNPERDAAVDALLAAYTKDSSSDLKADENDTYTDGNGRKSGAEIAHPVDNGQHHTSAQYDTSSQREGRPRAREYSRKEDSYREHGGVGVHSSTRHEVRSDYRYPDYDSRKSGVRQESNYWRGREEDPRRAPREAKIKGKANEYSDAERAHAGESRHAFQEEEQRAARHEDYYRAEASRDSRTKQGRYADTGVGYVDTGVAPVAAPEAEYAPTTRDYPHYPTQGRYAAPSDDPRYPPAAASIRVPETDYAALYYHDLTEWLKITGYHDVTYRQILLQRHRDMYAFDGTRRYTLPEEAGYAPRPPAAVPREDPDSRRVRGSSMYTMPPPPPPLLTWDEGANRRDGSGAQSSSRNSYPPSPANDRRYPTGEAHSTSDKGPLKRRMSAREGEYGEQPHSAKSARHAYEEQYRNPVMEESMGARYDSVHPSRMLPPNDPVDETDAVRQSLSRRLAATRGRDPSPTTIGEHRRHSVSPAPRSDLGPRDYTEGARGDHRLDHSPRFEKEHYGRGKHAFGRGNPKEDFQNSYRRSSFGENPGPSDRGSYGGRGRGRGGSKEFGRHDRTFKREFSGDQMSEADRYPVYTGGERDSGHPHEDYKDRSHERSDPRSSSTRYFMIKSFNEDNVKMAQQDCIWATQQKNAEVLEQAFTEARDVILFFSINKSGKFQGYARMEGAPGSAPVPSWSKNLLWESSAPFRIRWISITDINFHRVAHLKNQLNEGQPVLIGRDGQEIDPECGSQLCKTIDETAVHRKMHGNDL